MDDIKGFFIIWFYVLLDRVVTSYTGGSNNVSNIYLELYICYAITGKPRDNKTGSSIGHRSEKTNLGVGH